MTKINQQRQHPKQKKVWSSSSSSSFFAGSYLVVLLLLLNIGLQVVEGFGVPTTSTIHSHRQPQYHRHQRTPHLSQRSNRSASSSSSSSSSLSLISSPRLLTTIRGGGSSNTGTPTLTSMMMMNPLISSVYETLVSATTSGGITGIASLWAVASSVVAPLTLYRQGYAFSVGYGFSIMGMAIWLCGAFKINIMSAMSSGNIPSLLVLSAAVYGGRLGSYLLQRQIMSPTKSKQMKTFDKSPRLSRIPFAGAVSLFYAFLMTPCLYAVAGSGVVSSTSATITSTIGTILAWSGVIVEAVADYHKLYVKQKRQKAEENSNSSTNEDETKQKQIFVGPTGGVYRMTRHPNYTGELMFWFGQFIGGIPYLQTSIVGWISSLLGIYGIYGIMTNATKRLDERQKENYGDQPNYQEWRRQVKAPIFPFVQVE